MFSEDERVFIPAEHVTRMTVQDIQLALDNNKFPVQAMMQRLQQLGYSWKFMNQKQKNLLHFAAEEGDCEAIEILLDAKVYGVNDFETVLFQGYNYPSLTALHYACREDHFEAVELLISYGADVNLRGQLLFPLIMESIQEGNTEIFDFLLELGLSVKDEDRFGRNCLDQAAAKGNVVLLDRLLEMGFDPFRQSSFFQMTILHEACKKSKNVAMIKRIMDLKLNPYEPCKTYERPIDFLFMNGTRETLDLMLSCGVNLFTVGPRKETALHYACSESNLETAQWLIERGANLNEPTSVLGKVPLQLAFEQSCPAMIELLARRGANKSFYTANGDTLLIAAVRKNDMVLIDALLRAGFNPNDLSLDKKLLPLDCAAATGNYQLMDQLLAGGADINATDLEGWTCLHKMALFGDLQAVFNLLQRGANADAKDIKHYSPLDLTRDETIANMLIENGANNVGCCTQFYKLLACCFCCQCNCDERF